MNVNHSKSKSLESASILCLAFGIFGLIFGLVSVFSGELSGMGIAIAGAAIYLIVMGVVMGAIVPITKNAENSLAESGDKDYIAKEPEKK